MRSEQSPNLTRTQHTKRFHQQNPTSDLLAQHALPRPRASAGTSRLKAAQRRSYGRIVQLAFGILGLCALLLPLHAEAYDIALTSDKSVTLKLNITDTFHYNLFLGSFVLDDTGQTFAGTDSNGAPLAQGAAPVFHRLRLSPRLTFGDWTIHAEGDLAIQDTLYSTNNPLGTRFSSPISQQANGFRIGDFRQLWVSWRSPIGLFKLGQQSLNWGLGILSNGGDRQTGEFALPRFGDIVERFGWAFPLFRLFSNSAVANRFILSAGISLVYRDENASLWDGDITVQGDFSFFYRKDEDFFIGMFVALRHQNSADGTRISAQAYDFFARFHNDFDQGTTALEAALEFAVITGFTDRLRTEEAREGVDLLNFGGVARIGVKFPKIGLRLGVEVGYASGDDNTNDSLSQQFRFDPNYQPSLILFKRLLGAITARATDRLTDPDRTGYPAPGSDQVPTYGRIGNAIYFQPVIAYRPFVPLSIAALKRLELKVGLLYAAAANDFADPYNSFRSGGTNTTHMGQPAVDHHDLGFELNVGLSYGYKIWHLDLQLTLLYGHLFPGSALTDPNGKNTAIDLLQFRTVIRF